MTTTDCRLTFADPGDPDRIELAVPQAVTLDTSARTIGGRILPYGVQAARTSYGKPVKFMAGALIPPADLSRVKLLIDHDHGRPVGYAVELNQDDTEASATFTVPAGPGGDIALAEARDHLRDGLSVGVDIRKGYNSPDGTEYVVEQAVITEVSLCAIPAFEDARVTKVTASTRPDPEEDDDQDADDDAPDEDDDEEDNTPTEQEPAEQENNMKTKKATFNHAPAFQGTTAGKGPMTLQAAIDAISGAIRTASSASELRAALTDIVPADDAGHGLLGPSQVGELWKAVEQERPYIDFAYTGKPLSSGFKMVGWAWKTLPEVGDYAGNKTEVPSNKAATELIEASVERIAGGWDIDRIYVDLADGAMLREVLNMAVIDARNKTNEKARAALLAAATKVYGPTTFAETLITLGSKAATIGSRIDYLAIAPDMWAGFAALTRDQVPWWFGANEGIDIGASNGTAGKVKTWVDPGLAAGTYIAGDKRAATWWEKNPPVRVQAVDIAKGGVDLGVFGYFARKVNEPRAVFTGNLAVTVAP